MHRNTGTKRARDLSRGRISQRFDDNDLSVTDDESRSDEANGKVVIQVSKSTNNDPFTSHANNKVKRKGITVVCLDEFK